MAQGKVYNEETGQEEDSQVTNPNDVGTGTGTAPPTTKTYNPFDREKFKNDWMSQGGNYGGDVEKFINAEGFDPSQFNQISGSNGAWRLPTNEAMDLVIDKGGSNKPGWTGLGDMKAGSSVITPYAPEGGAPAAPAYTPPPTAPAPTGAPPVPTAGLPSSPATSALHDQLIATLTSRANQSLNVDPNDPIIAAQTNAYNADQQRQLRQRLGDIAEKKGPYGDMAAETRSGNEVAGQNTANLHASLMQNELTARRDEIQNALSSQQGILTADEQIQLQMKLAQMNDQLQRLQLAQQGTQFNANLGYQYAGLNQAGSQFDRNLASQNDQFLANFGLNSTNQSNYWDALHSGLINA